MRSLYFLCLALAWQACAAQVVKCRDEAGRIAYGQQPCPTGHERLELSSQPFSVVEQGEQDKAATQRYRRDLQDWVGKQEKARQKAAVAEERARRDQRKKWLAERERCQRLAEKKRVLHDSARQAASNKEADRAQMRLAKVEDQMQDRACHLYKDD